MVPRLSLPLDLAYSATGPHLGPNTYRDLLEVVEYVHARQAGSDRLEVQQPVDAGRIEAEALVADLRAADYDWSITAEYIASLDGVDLNDAKRQGVTMREVLESLP